MSRNLDKQTTRSQKEAFAAELQKIKINVSANDRIEAQKALGIKSHSTISEYLNGKVKDLDTAEKLIVFLRAKVNQRELVLSGANA